MGKFYSNALRLYWGGFNPGTATTSAALGLVSAVVDDTSWGDEAESFTPTLRQDTLTWAGIFDDGSDSMDAAATALLGSSTNNVLSFLVGTGTGSIAYAGTIIQTVVRAPVTFNELVRHEAEFQPDQPWDRGFSYGEATSITTATGSGTTGTIDNSAISTATAAWYLQVTTGSFGAGTAIVYLQAATTSDWIDIATAGGINARTSVRVLTTGSAGTIHRRTRMRVENDGTSITIAGVLSRSPSSPT